MMRLLRHWHCGIWKKIPFDYNSIGAMPIVLLHKRLICLNIIPWKTSARTPQRSAPRMPDPTVPDFDLPATGGATFSTQNNSKPYVLYFYPKDNTPGCTAEGVQ